METRSLNSGASPDIDVTSSFACFKALKPGTREDTADSNDFFWILESDIPLTNLKDVVEKIEPEIKALCGGQIPPHLQTLCEQRPVRQSFGGRGDHGGETKKRSRKRARERVSIDLAVEPVGRQDGKSKRPVRSREPRPARLSEDQLFDLDLEEIDRGISSGMDIPALLGLIKQQYQRKRRREPNNSDLRGPEAIDLESTAVSASSVVGALGLSASSGAFVRQNIQDQIRAEVNKSRVLDRYMAYERFMQRPTNHRYEGSVFAKPDKSVPPTFEASPGLDAVDRPSLHERSSSAAGAVPADFASKSGGMTLHREYPADADDEMSRLPPPSVSPLVGVAVSLPPAGRCQYDTATNTHAVADLAIAPQAFESPPVFATPTLAQALSTAAKVALAEAVAINEWDSLSAKLALHPLSPENALRSLDNKLKEQIINALLTVPPKLLLQVRRELQSGHNSA